MGLEKLPTCPEGVVYGSHEWGNWYNSLSEENQALLWVNAKEEKVKNLQATPSIDTEKKIWEVIVGGMADATGGIYGACLLAQGEAEDKEGIVSGLKLTWLKATKTIEKLGHFLPDKCRQSYDDLLKEYSPFVETTLDRSSPYSHKEFLEQAWKLYLGLQTISTFPLGVDKANIGHSEVLWD